MEQSTRLLAPIRTSHTAPPRPMGPQFPDLSITDNSVEIGNTPRPASAPHRFVVRPLVDPETTLDLTDAVVAAIARELGDAFGGNAVLNRLEADAHLASLLGAAARPFDDDGARAHPRAGERARQTVPLGLPLHIDGEQHAG